MARSKNKMAGANRQIPGTANPNLQQQQNVVEMAPSTEVPQTASETAVDSPVIVQQQQQQQDSMVSPPSSNAHSQSVSATGTPVATAPVVTLSNFSSNPVNITSSSSLATSPSSHSHLSTHAPVPQLSSSISTSSVHMIASSISTDRLSNVHLNPTLLDDDEIGHAIPTPECLPQSRKHSIVQSKLATPTLSSS